LVFVALSSRSADNRESGEEELRREAGWSCRDHALEHMGSGESHEVQLEKKSSVYDKVASALNEIVHVKAIEILKSKELISQHGARLYVCTMRSIVILLRYWVAGQTSLRRTKAGLDCKSELVADSGASSWKVRRLISAIC
jgi:hypothetical protein